jgi:hypothetical protein
MRKESSFAESGGDRGRIRPPRARAGQLTPVRPVRGSGAVEPGLAALLILFLSGCATTILPPEIPADAGVEEVFLIDHGRHPSLVLPDGAGGAVRYAYGDWRWFAEGDRGAAQGGAALLRPTPAALGRQQLDADHEQAIRGEIPEMIKQVLAFEAPRAAVVRLRRELDTVWLAQRDRALYNPAYRLTFVPHPEDYSLRNNSNVMAARWLQQLGAEVRGATLLPNWRLAERDGAQ